MKVLLDLNLLLDVVQHRVPHYEASAQVLSCARRGEITATIPAHAVTTLFYVLRKASGQAVAETTTDWLLQHFEIARTDKAVLAAARALPMPDFEDAVVAASAAGCQFIVTRNVADFAGSPVPAITPTALLGKLNAPKSAGN